MRLVASMGPWLRSHGRGPTWRPCRCPCQASMGPWLRSHGRQAGWSAAPWSEQLQWGRGFAATEGPRWIGLGSGAGRASMGPWLRSHGRRRPWAERGCGGSASMGPWLRSHGRDNSRAAGTMPKWLQWGRGFAATEGGVPRASKWPAWLLQWGRGFAATEGCGAGRSRGESIRFNGAVASQPRKGQFHFTEGARE